MRAPWWCAHRLASLAQLATQLGHEGLVSSYRFGASLPARAPWSVQFRKHMNVGMTNPPLFDCAVVAMPGALGRALWRDPVRLFPDRFTQNTRDCAEFRLDNADDETLRTR